MYYDHTDLLAEVFSRATGYSPRSAHIERTEHGNSNGWSFVTRYKVTVPGTDRCWTVEESFHVEDYVPQPSSFLVWAGDPADPRPDTARAVRNPRP